MELMKNFIGNIIMDKIIIHIDGVQGSGKSYICSKLKNIKCIDTDDIMKKSINIIEKSQKTNKKMPRTFEQLQKIKKLLVNDYIKKHNKIIFVGMTANIPNITHKFFIKLDDFTTTYKRLLLRELNKIVKNEKKIIKHIQKENNPKEIDVQRFADMSMRFPVDYDAFLEDYKERLKDAKNNGYKPKTQDEIIEFIQQL